VWGGGGSNESFTELTYILHPHIHVSERLMVKKRGDNMHEVPNLLFFYTITR
jgi:hypothetical protein